MRYHRGRLMNEEPEGIQGRGAGEYPVHLFSIELFSHKSIPVDWVFVVLFIDIDLPGLDDIPSIADCL